MPLLSAASAVAQIAGQTPLESVTVSEARKTSTGEWQYTLKKSTQPWFCEGASAASRCVEQVVTISNRSGETLECRVRVDFKGADGATVSSQEVPALVLPRTHPDVFSTISDSALRAEVAVMDCKARTPYRRLGKDEGCHFSFMGKPFETYYPDEAKLRGLQGPVIVSFFLRRREGDAQDVTVAESSLVPELDAAAQRFIRDQLFTTNCPGRSYDLLMRFKLRDEAMARLP
jgi:TonB family protein